MTCKGICSRHKAKRPILGTRYGTGQKRCQTCEVFFQIESNFCLCCGYRLRVRPRNRLAKEKMQYGYN